MKNYHTNTQDLLEKAKLTAADVACARIARIREALIAASLDGMYIRKISNIKWATAFINVFDEEPAHALLITQNAAILHTDSRYVTAAHTAAEGTPIQVVANTQTHAEFLCAHLSDAEKLKIAIEDSISLAEFRKLESTLADTKAPLTLEVQTGFIEALRQVKDQTELAFMQEAQRITDAAFTAVCAYIKPGMTEVHIQRALDAFMFDEGATGLAFPTIVAAGAHAASPHAIPGNNPVQPGYAVVMDFGARFADYCSDMTRTIFIGTPSPKIQAAYQAIRQANEDCERALKAGKTGAEIHQLAEDILSQHGFANAMGHGLGHSLGIDIHESPSLSSKNPKPLPAGATITVEPGIYIPGEFGMRLEDFGVITESGFDVFTQSTHDMVIIDAL